MMSKRMLVMLIALIGLSILGCGGDESVSSGTGDSVDNNSASDSGPPVSGGGGEGKPISKSAFLKKGNAICDKTVREVVAKVLPVLEKEGEADRESLETELASEVLIPELQSQVDEIRALGAPAEGEKEVEAFLGAVEAIIEEGEDNPTTLVNRGNSGFGKPSKLAERYGLASCPYG
jgi:hypothetical protein